MKTWPYTSLALNLVLLASVGSLATRESAPPRKVQLPAPGMKPAPKPVAAAAKPFHWSQIESEDFPVYVANLRAIGCPEATIRDIVAGELKEIYDEKRRSVAGKEGPSGVERRAVGIQLQKLAAEESAVAARVLNVGAALEGNPAGTAGGTDRAAGRALRAFYPTVFQDPGALVALGLGSSAAPNAPAARGSVTPPPQPVLTPRQAEAVQQLQQQFVDDIGGPNQNATDPAYLKRWQAAQLESDESLRAQLGWAAFSDYQLALAQKAQAEAAPPAK